MARYSKSKQTRRGGDTGIRTRMALILVLAVTFLGAIRWAINVTNANARQLSANLSHIQNQYGTVQDAPLRYSTARVGSPSDPEWKSGPGPSIEPETKPGTNERR